MLQVEGIVEKKKCFMRRGRRGRVCRMGSHTHTHIHVTITNHDYDCRPHDTREKGDMAGKCSYLHWALIPSSLVIFWNLTRFCEIMSE
jgi:hypothetical protein